MDDYVPQVPGQLSPVEAATRPFDYARVDPHESVDQTGQNVPSSEDDIDLDTEVVTDFLGDTSADAIEKSSYRQPPPGVHVFEIHSMKWLDNGRLVFKKGYVKRLSDGEVRCISYDVKVLQISFNVLNDEFCQIRTMFTMAPSTREELEAYEYGFEKAEDAAKNDRGRGGFAAKQLKHFLARLGFQNDANGKLPLAANKLRNWVYYEGTDIKRQIRFEVMPPKLSKPYLDKKTNQMVTPTTAYSNIKYFSFAYVPEPPSVALARSRKKAVASSEAARQPLPTEATPVATAPVVVEPPKVEPNGGTKQHVKHSKSIPV